MLRQKAMKDIKKQRPEIMKVQGFEEFMRMYRNYYVDKTLWIKEVLENKERI